MRDQNYKVALEFNKIASTISYKEWEEALPIGEYISLKIGEIVKRNFSTLARCKVIGNDDYKDVYIKIYNESLGSNERLLKRRVLDDYNTSMFWFKIFSESKKFNVVKPVMVIPDKYMIVTEEAKGTNLYKIIAKSAYHFTNAYHVKKTEKQLYNVGKWLEYRNIALSDNTNYYSIEEYLQYIELRLDILTNDKRRKIAVKYRERIVDYINNLKIPEEDLISVMSHNDFNPGNIIIDDDQITVLDFGRSRKDSFFLDVCKLYYQLYLFTLKPQYSKKIISIFQKSLLKGFGFSEAENKKIFKLMIIRNTITHLVKITKFWECDFLEKIYNQWVLYRELKKLRYLMSQK